MKTLIKKINRILKDRGTRRLLTRIVSVSAAMVVFVTTYALVLPAITMETEAQCGIEAHQHSDSCYEDVLVCGLEESEGHTHDDSCYSISHELTCEIPEHQHDKTCYDEDGNLQCKLSEHDHTDNCYKEVRELTCTLEESEGHHHTDACYEKNLICGKEVHTHSSACYEKTDTAAVAASEGYTAGVAYEVNDDDAADDFGSSDTDGLEVTDDAGYTDGLEAAGESDDVDTLEETDGPEDADALEVTDGPGDTDAPEWTDHNDASEDAVTFEETGDPGDTDASEQTDDPGEPDALEVTSHDAIWEDADSAGTSKAADYSDSSEEAGSADPSQETDNTGLSDWDPPLQEESEAAPTTNVLPEGLENEELSDGYVPHLDSLNFDSVLNDHTAFYYFHPEEGEEVPANSVDIASWKPVDENTELAPTDLVKAYLAYTIPAGSLNETNQVARYRLPSNLHLTEEQILAINSHENGIAAGYIDPETNTVPDEDAANYSEYLGAEVVEGTRRPDQALSDGSLDGEQEYISATVKAENVFDEEGLYGEKGAYLGQDLIFVFSPYTIQKNQTTYDKDGKPTARGEKVTGWFAVDFNMDQIDWSEPIETILPADNEGQTTAAEGLIAERNQAMESVQEQIQGQEPKQEQDPTQEQAQTETDDNIQSQENTGKTTHTALQRIERIANIVFAAEGKDENNHKIQEISAELKLVQENATEITTEDQPVADAEEQVETPESDEVKKPSDEKSETDQTDNSDSAERADSAENDANVDADSALAENKEGETEKAAPEYKDGTLEANGSGYKITMDYKADARIPENAYLHVTEITRESDTEAYEACLEEARKSVPADGTRVDDKASRFFDIEILVDETASMESENKDLQQDEQKNTAEDHNNAETEESEPEKSDLEKTESEESLPEKQTTTRKIEPAAPVSVNIQLFDTEISQKPEEFNAEQYKVVHIAEDKTEEIQDVKAQTIEPEKKDATSASAEKESDSDTTAVAPVTEVQFEADSFSIYGVVYTVDFHWEVDGKTFDFSIPGSGFASFYNLVEVLGIEKNDASTEEDEIQKLVDGVESISFSDPELVSVSKVEEDTTVGTIKERLGLECEYSAELTEEQIAEINAQTVGTGDWALISLKAFDTEEYLTVTMKTGEVFQINVTDDQENPFGLDGKSFAITAYKNNQNYYLSSDGNGISTTNSNCLRAIAYNPNNWGTPMGSIWTFEWTGEGKKYLIHDNQNRYILIENDKVSLTDRDTALANPITVVSREGKYSFVNEKNNQALNIFGNQGFGRWPYAESNTDFLMTLQNPSNLKKPGTISTADTSGLLQINLFDYDPENELDKEARNNTSPYSGGINSGHTLKFFSYGKNVGTGVNDFTGQGNGPRTGIVADQLSGDYPVLASNSNESLDYLFGGKSNDYVTPYTGLNHLFTKDENGYYHYDSDQNYAYLNGSDFKVYSKTFPEEGADEQYFGVGFFPFNDYNEDYNCIHGKDGFEKWDPHTSGTNKNGHYNHHFGMSLTGNFIMPPDGQYNGKDVTFQFSGDDDMWVYVDGVLIMDIGGVHNPVHGEINFTTGEVTVHGAAQENFKEKYKRITGNDWDDSDFSNHDFRVFYMERGGMYSNLEVTFNLPLTPKTETNNFQFDKVSSENESLKLSGAEFSLFNDPSCSDPFTLASVPVKATSDKNGVVSFKNIPHGTYYMKETVYPEGYQAKTPEEIFTVVVNASGGTITSSSGDSISQVTNKPKKIDIEVEKVWSNGIVPNGAEIEIVLGRYKLVEDPNAPGTATLVIKDSYTGLPSGSNYHVTYTITGPDGYSNTITKSYTDSSKQIEESVEVPATVAGSQYTVTKQVQNISYHNINNQNQTVNVTVAKNGTGQTQFNQSTFTRNAYRVRIYAVNSTDPNNLYSEDYYPAGSNLSVRIDHKNYNWGFFSFTVSSNTGWNSGTFTSDSQQQFTSNLNQDIDLVLHCSRSDWTKGHDWIKDPYITGANPVRAASAGRMMMSMRRGASTQSMSQTASAPTLPDPPQNTLYVLDEEYAANPDKITLSGGTWTGKAEDLDAYNEYGPYVYYIASVNESGMPEGTQITISDEVSMDGAAQILTVTNTVPTGDLQITKNILKNGTTDASATGTFYYAVFNEEYNPSADPAQSPARTGSIVVSSNGTQTVTETGLICGTYYVYELNGENGTPIVSGNDGSVQVIGGICYTVTGSGSTANVGSNAGAAVLTNNQETVDITTTKQWQDKNGMVLTGTNIPTNAKVTFTLLADGTATSHTVEVNGVDDTAGGVTPATADYEGVNWTAYFTGLPKYTNAGTLINYTVQETGTWDGYVVDGNATVSSGGTIINKQQTVEINILKVDKTDGTTPLTGAKFVLKRYNEGYHGVQETWPEQTVSSEEGKKGTLIIDGLTVGYYELEETESPAGYIRISAFPRFEVAVNPTTKELEVIFTDNTGGMVSYDPTNNVFTVRNEPGAALPNTGGPGTRLFTILGSILTLGAGVLLWRRRRLI